jgi:hypothetical protein
MINVWFMYQLNLNWLNILFRYAVKLLLIINLFILAVGITYRFKGVITQFTYLIAGVALTDLLLKFVLKKRRQDLRAFHVITNGVVFLSGLNMLLDIFSARNTILPLLIIVLLPIAGHETNPSLVYLCIISCMNNLAAGFTKRRDSIIPILATVALIITSICFPISIPLTIIYTTLVFLLLIYLRHNEKLYVEETSLTPRLTNSIYSISNPFLWLDLQALKKSRHLQLTIVKVIAICLLYCYIISARYTPQGEIGFGTILLIQVYYWLPLVLLIPYILSSDYSHIGMLMTRPDLKSFFKTKLNMMLLIQLLLTLVLSALNFSNGQALFLINSIFIFNIFIITPVMFVGTLLTDEKVNIFGSGINNFIFIPPFIQSVYFLVVLICTAVILYLLHNIGLNNFSWTLIGLGGVAFFLKETYFRYFLSTYNNRKYDLFKKLSQ